MTPESKLLVRESWARVEPIGEVAAALFYGRLFELNPELRHRFHGDMAEQGRKLMQTLTVLVRGLDRLDDLLPAVQSLGRRHGAYGVRDAHYTTVEQALLWTLERALGDAFTPAVRGAWTEACGKVASLMQRPPAGAPVPLHGMRFAAAQAAD